jgi:stage III sporulation protein AF
MYSIFKDWVTSIVVVILFLALVDMIMPSGSLKKYARLATGLIVIIVIIKPIFNIFSHDNLLENNINKYVNSYGTTVSKDIGNLNQGYSKETINIFKKNLIGKLEEEIFKECKKKYTVSKLTIDENSKGKSFLKVKFIELMDCSKANKIEKISKIDLNNNKESEKSFWDKKAAAILIDNYGINASDIKFVR